IHAPVLLFQPPIRIQPPDDGALLARIELALARLACVLYFGDAGGHRLREPAQPGVVRCLVGVYHQSDDVSLHYPVAKLPIVAVATHQAGYDDFRPKVVLVGVVILQEGGDPRQGHRGDEEGSNPVVEEPIADRCFAARIPRLYHYIAPANALPPLGGLLRPKVGGGVHLALNAGFGRSDVGIVFLLKIALERRQRGNFGESGGGPDRDAKEDADRSLRHPEHQCIKIPLATIPAGATARSSLTCLLACRLRRRARRCILVACRIHPCKYSTRRSFSRSLSVRANRPGCGPITISIATWRTTRIDS